MAAIPEELSLIDEITASADAQGLTVMGLAPEADTLVVLLGTGPKFWTTYKQHPISNDGQPDPIDRWSVQIICQIATRIGLSARFPFGGPPFEPFIRWALASGRCWQSPTGMLVHDTAGLMISFRGALISPRHEPIAQEALASPCKTCRDQPCATACPVGALSASHPYDVERCKAFLHSPLGTDCLKRGCAVRRACPISQYFERTEAQSALHMEAFLNT